MCGASNSNVILVGVLEAWVGDKQCDVVARLDACTNLGLCNQCLDIVDSSDDTLVVECWIV